MISSGYPYAFAIVSLLPLTAVLAPLVRLSLRLTCTGARIGEITIAAV